MPNSEFALFRLAVKSGSINAANAIIKGFIDKQAGVIGNTGYVNKGV